MTLRTSPGARASGAAAAIAAAALIVTPFTAAHEGMLLTPKPDQGGKLTWCDGETRGTPLARYTPAQCQAILDRAIRSDFAPPVLACVPQLAGRPYAFAASIDTAYNAGVGAFCGSPAAARFRLGDWRGGCQALIGWRATIKGKPSRGLANRRDDEAELCAKGAA